MTVTNTVGRVEPSQQSFGHLKFSTVNWDIFTMDHTLIHDFVVYFPALGLASVVLE